MRITTRIIRGYAAIIQALGGYIAIAGIVAAAAALIVVPLWLLADRYPRLYSALAMLALALLFVTWIGIRMVGVIQRRGLWWWLGRSSRRIAVAVLVLAAILGLVQPTIWIKVGAALLLLAAIGMVGYRLHRERS